MILKIKDEAIQIANKVIIGDAKSKFNGSINAALKSDFKFFLKSDKEVDFVKNMEGTVFFVKSELSNEKLRVAGFTIRQQLDKTIESIEFIGDSKSSLLVAEGLALSNYQFIKYFKDNLKRENKLNAIYLPSEVSKKQIQETNNIINAVYWTRNMVNEPVSYLTAVKFAEEIKNLCEPVGVKVDVLEKAKIEALKMGGLLAVNKGSIDPPTFTILEYKPKKATNKQPIVLVGKGVVYDTGGLSLKPTPGSMDCMKSDMAGAAGVVGAIYAAAINKEDKHIVGLIPATDNRPGQTAYTPGDVITMFDGTTVEVLNTDAEGRMILADALAYSKKFKPELVMDMATLTGAALRAIGANASIIMGNAEAKVFEKLEKSGNETHERVVKFPFWDEYLEPMKSSIADLKNIGGADAGMITAGKFLEHFVEAPYVHIDIAGPSWLDSPQNYKGKGGTGYGVRLLYHFIKNYK